MCTCTLMIYLYLHSLPTKCLIFKTVLFSLTLELNLESVAIERIFIVKAYSWS